MATAFIEFFGQMQAIHRMKHIKEHDCITAFIGLQITDKVPTQMSWTIGNLCLGFLHSVLTK